MLDFKNFKKTHEDDKVATLKHPDGHEVKIAKASLSPDLQKRLKKLPLHQSDPEGPVEDPEAKPEASSPAPGVNIFVGGSQPMPQAQAQDAAIAKNSGAQNQMPVEQVPQPEQPAPPQDLSSGQPAQPGQPNLSQYQQLPEFALGEASAKGSMDAAKQYGSEVSAATNEFRKDQAMSQLEIHRDFDAKQKEIDAVVKDIKDNHINPNHYLESKNIGGRITTALGLLLGGIGAGFSHGPNMALTFLNSQIERDLEAQKDNQSGKENLLSALGQQFKNIQVRDEMFRAIRAQTLASELQGLAAKNNVSMASPTYQKALADLIGPARQTLMKASLLDMQGKVEGSPGSQAPSGPMNDQAAQRYLQAARVIDPKQAEEFEKRYVPNIGVAAVPLDPKDREFIQKNTELRDLYQQAQKILQKTPSYGTMPFSGDRAEAKSVQNQMQLKMGELASLSRFTPEENKIYQQTVPDLTGTHFTHQDQSKMDAMMRSMNDKLNTFYKQKGLGREASDADMIKVLSPDGRSGDIPKVNLSKALKLGYKQVQ